MDSRKQFVIPQEIVNSNGRLDQTWCCGQSHSRFSELTVPWEDAAAVTHEGKMLRLKLAAEMGQQGYKTGEGQLGLAFADRSR